MTPIRPANLPAGPAATPRSDAGRAAAQKAFFEMAMGRPAAAAPAAQAAASFTPAAAPQPAQVRPQSTQNAPSKVPRPGSLLDIRV